MRDHLQTRLGELKAEFESGQRMMQELESRQAKLRDQLLRLSGAVAVLEEVLSHGEPESPAGRDAAGGRP